MTASFRQPLGLVVVVVMGAILKPSAPGLSDLHVCSLKAWCFMVFYVHPRVSLEFPIEVGMYSMEGDIDVAGGDLAPIEVEVDAIGYARRLFKSF
ncbi:hypothetical protein SUGI_1116410 [Cryptomeria japonica]|nr:hypothetical protein SUGI_1116410 [Cryptomeria japonica]